MAPLAGLVYGVRTQIIFYCTTTTTTTTLGLLTAHIVLICGVLLALRQALLRYSATHGIKRSITTPPQRDR